MITDNTSTLPFYEIYIIHVCKITQISWEMPVYKQRLWTSSIMINCVEVAGSGLSRVPFISRKLVRRPVETQRNHGKNGPITHRMNVSTLQQVASKYMNISYTP